MPFSRSSSITRGTIALCAPERMDNPITWTSSCKRGVYDHLRSLAQAGVNYFHARVAESPRDNLRSPVVAIQTRFGDQHPDAMIHTPRF